MEPSQKTIKFAVAIIGTSLLTGGAYFLAQLAAPTGALARVLAWIFLILPAIVTIACSLFQVLCSTESVFHRMLKGFGVSLWLAPGSLMSMLPIRAYDLFYRDSSNAYFTPAEFVWWTEIYTVLLYALVIGGVTIVVNLVGVLIQKLVSRRPSL